MFRDLLSLPVVAAGPVQGGKCVTFAGLQAGAGDPVLGIARTDQVAGKSVTVTVLGTETVKAGGAIPQGAKLASDANGDVVADAAAANPVGRALNAAAQGETVTVLLGR